MNKNKCVLLLMLVFLAGCEQVIQKNHILAVNEIGKAYDPGTCNVFGMDCDPLTESLESHLNNLLETSNKENQKRNNLVIYIHGGLNTPNTQIEKANELIPIIEATGFKPIFIDWRSGLITSYRDHLLFERQSEFWPIAGPLTFPFILISDLGRGVTRLPINLWESVSNFNKAHILHSENTPSEANAAKITGLDETFEKANPKYAGFGELPKPLNDKSMGKSTAFDTAADFVETSISLSTLPLFDAIGSGAWATMKRRTEILFTRERPHYSWASKVFGGDGEFNDYHNIKDYKESREGAVSKFFKKLEQAQKDNPNLKITLVGHSMGAIVANKALSRFPEIKYEKIIYMAAACSIEDYRLSVLPYLRNHDTEFYNYTLHPIAENTEANLLGLGGTGSLLAQIDNIYEAPTSENQRTLGRWSNTMNGINYLTDDADEKTNVKQRLFFRTMPLGCGYPQKHGDFDDDKFVRTSSLFWKGMLGDTHDKVECK